MFGLKKLNIFLIFQDYYVSITNGINTIFIAL